MSIVSRASLIVLCLLFGVGAHAQDQCTENLSGVPATRMSALSRGFNLAGRLDSESTPVDVVLLRELRRRGMTHIRLPVPAESMMSRFTEASRIASQAKRITLVTRELLALGYSVSIDLHPGERFSRLHKANPVPAMESIRDAWMRLAELIKPFPPESVFAEVLNEPDVEPARWRAEAESLVKLLREQLPYTTIILGPTAWQRPEALAELPPLDDRNIVYAIHFYDPMPFTHQGHWDQNNPLSLIKGLPFPIDARDKSVEALRKSLRASGNTQAFQELEKAIAASAAGDIVRNRLQPAVDWQTRFRRPVIVNEFGVLKHRAPRESRIRWLKSVVDFAESHCWGWAHWEFAQGFGLLNDAKELDEAVVQALLKRR